MSVFDALAKIIEAGFCSGCGVCVASCASSCLAMRFTEQGELAPILSGACISCGVCLRVCPFAPDNPDTTLLARMRFADRPKTHSNEITGHYLASYYAYRRDEEVRWQASSGGICGWLLEELLRQKMVDTVLLVAPSSGQDLFAYKAVTGPAEVRSASRSVYYPVDAAKAVRLALETPGRYALVGLPCVLRGVELLKAMRPLLRERIVFSLGLVCGQQKSAHFTEFLAVQAGLRESPVIVDYRTKQRGEPASNFAFCFRGASGDTATISMNDSAQFWADDWFKVHACNACDDIFAECADITLMDAWLPAFARDSRGANLLLVRNPQLKRLLDIGAADGVIHLAPVEIEQVIASQQGVVDNKRLGMATRMSLGMSPPLPARFSIPPPGTLRERCWQMLTALLYRAKYRINLLTRQSKGRSVLNFHLQSIKRATTQIRWIRRIREAFRPAR
jgi:coenzyme F420 hydrogenase subunit beta